MSLEKKSQDGRKGNLSPEIIVKKRLRLEASTNFQEDFNQNLTHKDIAKRIHNNLTEKYRFGITPATYDAMWKKIDLAQRILPLYEEKISKDQKRLEERDNLRQESIDGSIPDSILPIKPTNIFINESYENIHIESALFNIFMLDKNVDSFVKEKLAS